MPYSMRYYYSGIENTSDYIDVKVYWFSIVDMFGASALCYTTSDPVGSKPEGLKKGMWVVANNRYLVPAS